MKIQKMYAYNMQNDAHFKFHTEFKKLVLEHNPETLKIKPLFDKYLLFYKEEHTALKKINESTITKRISYADKKRDMIWYGLLDTNTAALKHFNPNVKNSAAKLKTMFESYGNITKKRLHEQTHDICNILRNLRGKYAEDVVTVGLTEWVKELSFRNELFVILTHKRYDGVIAKMDMVLKYACSNTNSAYIAIKNRINALIEVEGEELYGEFVKKLNFIIAKYAVIK